MVTRRDPHHYTRLSAGFLGFCFIVLFPRALYRRELGPLCSSRRMCSSHRLHCLLERLELLPQFFGDYFVLGYFGVEHFQVVVLFLSLLSPRP
jgi:hypothetical protein